MYVPRHFEEQDLTLKTELIRANPLATLITHDSKGLNANHIPLFYSCSPAPLGTLRGHVPRANPLASLASSDTESLAVFLGPNGYITPSWYATKPQTGKVVPTWNYTVVHAYGEIRIVDDFDWVRSQVEELTNQQESGFDMPWKVSDAPSDYIDRLVKGLVGIELSVTSLIGKNKASQNQPAENQSSVVEGLLNLRTSESEALAALIKIPREE